MRLRPGLTAALLAGVLALLGAAAAQSDSEDPRSSWCVAVWYPSSEHPAGAANLAANLDVIDVVHAFWFTPDATGNLIDRSGADADEKVATWRAAGALVVPSIFAGHSTFLAEELVDEHVAEIAALVDGRGFDGIDIDYEGFPFETREPFSRFVEALATEMHARGKLLFVTVHAKTEDLPPYSGSAAQDWARLTAAADVFNLMTYDYTNRNEPPGPIADLAWVDQVVEYAASVTDLDKVVVGIPFYAYSWNRGRPPAVAATWEAADRMVRQFSLSPTRDPASGELHVELRVTGLPRQDLFVSDAATTAGRLERLPEGSGGVAIWGIGGEDPANWEVLRRARPASCHLRGVP